MYIRSENYGSAMSPFYSVLALWVGALILVAIVHVKVHPIGRNDRCKASGDLCGKICAFLPDWTVTDFTYCAG